MTPALVSICIPAYNGAKYLAQCLQSAQVQTWSNVEIIVVDDGSTDDTAAIAQASAASDPRIRVLRNDRNLGLVGNWNRCVELARGEWIKYLFQDDWLEPECVETMLAVARHPLVFCRREFLFEDTEPKLRSVYERHLEEASIEGVFGRATLDVSPAKMTDAVLGQPYINFLGEPTACMLHRSTFEQFGKFDPQLVQLCDVEHAFRVGINTGFSYTPRTLAHFRVHGASTTQTNQRRGHLRNGIVDQLLVLHAQAVLPAYEPLRSLAAQRGVDLKHRFLAACSDEQLCGEHWAHPDWNDLIHRFPHLRMPPRLRLKRAAKLALRTVGLR